MRQKKYYKLIRVDYEDSAYMRLKNVSNETGIFKINVSGGASPNIEYSLDGVTWTTYDFSTFPEVTVAAGANIYFRGTNASMSLAGYNKEVKFNFNKSCTAHGNFFSLFNPDPAVFSTYTTFNNCQGLFRNCTTIISADIFSRATSIGQDGLMNAFNGCTSLTTPPDFSNLTSIGQQCLYSAFNDCTSLVTAPDFSNVTSIGSSGLSNSFAGCTSLTTTPDFSNVTSIGNNGLNTAFGNCYKLSTATAPNIQNLTTVILGNWLRNAGTSATGTKVVRVPTGATIATDSASGIPTGWTRVDY